MDGSQYQRGSTDNDTKEGEGKLGLAGLWEYWSHMKGKIQIKKIQLKWDNGCILADIKTHKLILVLKSLY